MPGRITALGVLAGVAAASLAGSVLTATAASAAPAPAGSAIERAYACTFDSTTHVTGVDWLLVHTRTSTSAPRVGQLPNGALVHYCSSSFTNGGGHTRVYGYGYNGSTRVTGWMVTDYLIFPLKKPGSR